VSEFIVVKITDRYNNVVRYEDKNGKPLAALLKDNVFNSSQLTITEYGISCGFMLVNDKLIKRKEKR